MRKTEVNIVGFFTFLFAILAIVFRIFKLDRIQEAIFWGSAIMCFLIYLDALHDRIYEAIKKLREESQGLNAP